MDEQLVRYRCKIPGRTLIPSNSKKYGVEFFWLRETTTGFALKGVIYSGKESNSGLHRNLANDIAMRLCSVYLVQVETYMLTGILPLMARCAIFCSKI